MLQRRAANDSLAARAVDSDAPQFETTSLDRILDRAQRVEPELTRASDLLLIGVAALLTIADIVVWATDPVVDTGRLHVSIAFLVPCLGAFAVVAVALRRRHLSLAIVTLVGASTTLTSASWIIGTSLPPSFASLFALALSTTVALRREPGGRAVLLAALAALAVASEAVRPQVSAAVYLLVVCEAAFAVAVGIGVYLRWSDWRRVMAEASARTEERFAIARELHDMVGHYVTGIVVQAQAARHVAERQPAAAAVALERIERAGADAMVAMRRMVGGLRDDPSSSSTAPRATWDEIDDLVANAVERGEPVLATIDPAVRGTAQSLASSVHRIIAESLTNVRRHAREVTLVEVAILQCADSLVVTVRDDGLVAAALGRDTFGIIGMRERAVSLGGSLFAGPAPGGGWLVHAELPMEAHR